MAQKLGQLERVDLRSIWKLEPDFSKWLSEQENLDKLGDAIGVEMLPEETEAPVGSFSADILAQEDGGDRKIIIENQYGCTNHDHLGKIITYASGRSAQILVWIVEDARDEHRAAIQWLNENMCEGIGIFLVKLDVYRIGDSEPAPMFTILEQPNNWVKQTHSNGKLTITKQNQQVFWQAFQDYAFEKRQDYKIKFNRRQSPPQHWLDLPIGSSKYHISLTVSSKSPKRVGVAIYIHKDKELFETFADNKEAIEHELGFSLDWNPLPNKQAARIIVTNKMDFEDKKCQQSIFDWLCDKAVAFKEVFPKYEN